MNLFNLKGTVELDSSKVVKGLDDIDDKAKKTSKSTEDLGRKSKEASDAMSKLGNMGKSAMGTVDKWVKRGVVAVGGLATAFIGLGLKANSSMEQYQASFATLMGSTDLAKEHIADLKQFANSTPFEMNDLASASQTLQAFGVNADNVMPTLKMLGDVSMGNKEKFNSLSLVFGQVSSQGKLMGQDLMQMINAGFNPLLTISQHTGESMESLKKRMSEGAVGVDEVTQAFQWATEEGGQFYNAMENQSKTFEGRLSTLKDGITTLAQNILTPIFEKISGYMPKLIEFTDNINKNITDGKGVLDSVKQAIVDTFGEETLAKVEKVIDIIKGIGIAYIALKSIIVVAKIVDSISLIVKAIKGMELAQLSLNFAFLTNPITWVIMAIVGVAWILWKNWDEVSERVTEAWNVMCGKIEEHGGGLKGFMGFLGEAISENWKQAWNAIDEKTGGALSAIKGKIEEHGGGIKGLWGAQWEAMNNITGGKLDAMVNTVKSWGDKIKSFFSNLHFPEIKIPHIKLPHFGITGNFSLNPPSIPKFNIDWYSTGAIFTQPTVLGNGIGVGDADNGRGNQAEAVMRYQDLMDIVKESLRRPLNVSVYLTSSEFAQALAPDMKEALDIIELKDVSYSY